MSRASSFPPRALRGSARGGETSVVTPCGRVKNKLNSLAPSSARSVVWPLGYRFTAPPAPRIPAGRHLSCVAVSMAKPAGTEMDQGSRLLPTPARPSVGRDDRRGVRVYIFFLFSNERRREGFGFGEFDEYNHPVQQ
jgi:hypothetical protein